MQSSAARSPTLPHVSQFAARDRETDLGHLVHGLVDEGKAVAAAAGVELHEDPWEMNVEAVRRGETIGGRGPLRARSVDARGRARAAPD